MSMLSQQCDKLRNRADELRMLASGMDAPYIVPSTKLTMAYAMSSAAVEMREAADTIEGLRDRLQADVMGSGTCEVVKEFVDIGGETMTDYSCCFNQPGWNHNYCPNCGRKVDA